MTAEALRAVRLTGYVAVPDELLDGPDFAAWLAGDRRPDPAVLAAHAEYEAHAQTEHAALLADLSGDELAAAVLALHAPTEHAECSGCEGGPDYSGNWPCTTYRLVAERHRRTFADGRYGTRMERVR